MKYLIVGSKGFIGSNLSEFLRIDKNHEVWEADIIADYNAVNYFHISDSQTDFLSIFQGKVFDVCINASGAASVPNSIKAPHHDFLLNAYNVHLLLEAIRTHSPSTKFINLSSAAVYGNPQTLPITENHTKKPISPYGYHKSMADQLCEEYYTLYDIHCASVRIFSAYGNGLKKQLFWDLFKKSENTSTLQLFGTGHESRDFIHISDICKALELLSNHPLNGDFYNLASGQETYIKDAVSIFFDKLHWNGKYEFMNQSRSGDPSNWVANISKLEKLGFSPKKALAEGINDYVKWLKEQQSH